MAEANWWLGLATIGLTGLIAFAVARAGKNVDARGLAEAALIGLGPQIIAAQNQRIDSLTAQCQQSWKREQECREELEKQGGTLATALARISALERRDD